MDDKEAQAVHRGQRLAQLREALDLSQTTVGLALQWKRTLVSAYELGRTRKQFDSLANFLLHAAADRGANLTVQWFDTNDPLPEQLQRTVPESGTVSDVGSLPVYEPIPAANWTENPTGRSIDIPARLVRSNRFLVQIISNDLAPHVFMGDWLVVEKETEPRPGRDALVTTEGETTVRRLARSGFTFAIQDIKTGAEVEGSAGIRGYIVGLLRGLTKTSGLMMWDDGGLVL